MTASAPTLVGLRIGDEPHAWRAAGFEVDSDGTLVVGGVRIELVGGGAGRGVRSAVLDAGPGPVHTEVNADGLHITFADPSPTSSVRHPNGINAVDHLVAATDDLERTTDALAAAGLVPHRTVIGVRGRGMTYRFFLIGTALLELVTSGGEEPNPSGAGAAFVGLAFVADDLGSLASLGKMADAPRAAVQPGRKIVTLHVEGVGISVPLAVMSPRS